MEKELKLRIVSKSGIQYESSVKSVSTVNKVGPMDILPNHEWFISPIFERVTIVDARNKTIERKITNAILRVKENQVEIFIEE